MRWWHRRWVLWQGLFMGGANEEVLTMLEEIGSMENVRPYIEDCVENKKKNYGFWSSGV